MSYSIEDFADYKAYLRTISKHLDFCFENQKEYICCKKGCAHCCESGQYPYSSLEFNYLLLGFFQIERNEQLKVILNCSKETIDLTADGKVVWSRYFKDNKLASNGILIIKIKK